MHSSVKMPPNQQAVGAFRQAAWGEKTAGSVWSEWNDLMFRSRPRPQGMERYGLLIDTRSTASLSHTRLSASPCFSHTDFTVCPVARPVRCRPVLDKQRPMLSQHNDGWPLASYFTGISHKSVRSQARLRVNSLLSRLPDTPTWHVSEFFGKNCLVILLVLSKPLMEQRLTAADCDYGGVKCFMNVSISWLTQPLWSLLFTFWTLFTAAVVCKCFMLLAHVQHHRSSVWS